VEILDYGNGGYLILPLLDFPRVFPTLMRVQAMDIIMDIHEVANLIQSLPCLRHIYIQRNCYLGGRNEVRSLTSSTLTTLYFPPQWNRSPDIVFENAIVSLPALRHLRFDQVPVDENEELSWLPRLRLVGKELRSLYVCWDESTVRVLAGIWGLCPKLEDLDGDGLELPPTTPPAGHTIHRIGVDICRFNGGRPPEEILLDWPSLRTLRVNASWDHWSAPWRPSWDILTKWLTLRGLSMQDKFGRSLTEYLARVGPQIDSS
jgi:hypothetical protein